MNDPADAVDTTPGDGACVSPTGTCTLRAAVLESNALAGTDEIVLPAGTYFIDADITPPDDDAAAIGDLDISDDVTISGSSAETTLIQPFPGSVPYARAIHILPGTQATIRNIAVQDFGYDDTACGGGLLNEGSLRLSSSHFRRNFAGHGGGVCNYGMLTVLQSLFEDHDISGAEDGAAISNRGTLTVRHSAFGRNSADDGGAIDSWGPLTVEDSEFSGNSACCFAIRSVAQLTIRRSRFVGNGGGAIGCTDALVEDSVFSQNSPCCFTDVGAAIDGNDLIVKRSLFKEHVSYEGGAIFARHVVIDGSSFEGNHALGSGGAISSGDGTIVNSTFSGNSAEVGGAIVSDMVQISNATIAGNSALDRAGGVMASGGHIRGTIIAGNMAPQSPDCDLAGVGSSRNLLGDGSGCGVSDTSSLVGTSESPVDPMLLPLSLDNGGPTPTMALLSGSPAIGAIPPAECTYDDDGDTSTAEVSLRSDQRGAGRPQGAGCDIGAFELTECSDGLDNDGDGSVDAADPGCFSQLYPTENPQCQDGLNNDPSQDEYIDFDGGASRNGGIPLASPDPQCMGKPWKNRERMGCGLGFELGVVMPVLGCAHRRRRLKQRQRRACGRKTVPGTSLVSYPSR